jgi:hypothetical protein
MIVAESTEARIWQDADWPLGLLVRLRNALD